MELPSPRSTAMEAALSLQHIFRVARAVNVDPQTQIEAAVAYVTAEEDVSIVSETWKLSFEQTPPLAVVIVDGLPRTALVEWHILWCQTMSEGVKSRRLRIVVDEDRLVTTVRECQGPYGVLAHVFGSSASISSVKSRYPKMAVQTVPARMVYSASKDRIERYNFCAFVMSG